MAPRNFFVLDSENLVVDSSPSAAIVGDRIINNSSTPNGTIFTFSAGGGATVTLDDFGGDPNVFADDDAANHTITNGNGLVADGQNVEAESRILVRALDTNGIQTGPIITLTVFSQAGVTGDVWGFSANQPLQDGVSYLKVGGSNIGTSRYDDFVACFGKGTGIKTPFGVSSVETLDVGDLVWTRDNGPQPIRWIACTQVPARGAMAPVIFEPGVLSNHTRLTVSPEHRMLVSGPQIELMFGCPDALIAAKHLCGLPGVSRKKGGNVCYYHLMFARHEILCSDGALSESFFLSQNALRGVQTDQVTELLTLFASLDCAIADFGTTAEMTLSGREAQMVAHQWHAMAA